MAYKDQENFLKAMCGKSTLSVVGQRKWLEFIRNHADYLDTKIQASHTILDDVTYYHFSDRLLETLLSHATNGPQIIAHIFTHHHDPMSDRVRPFWLPDSGIVQERPREFGGRYGHAHLFASSLVWQAIIDHPDTDLAARNQNGSTVTDLWAKTFCHQASSALGLPPENLASYSRLCQLMARSASLHQIAPETIAPYLLPLANSYLNRFTAPSSPHPLTASDITPTIFRHWSLAGLLDVATQETFWQGHTDHLTSLWLSLPEAERAAHLPQIVAQLTANSTQPTKNWTNKITSPSERKISI